ncbi:MAG: glycosyltransferase family 2 protein [Gemmatimonadota bacterium]|nr:glycosyltransferase family 2 protein [Gemmatimonadota bacterium]
MNARASDSQIPVVSVIVPAHNAERYLDDALRSLRAQTLADIEIIVVDDGSSDATRAIAMRHAADDARVGVLTRDEPSGKPSIPRNMALAASRGRYVAFLDADDTSVPTRLATMVRALELTGARFGFSDKRRLYVATRELAPESTLAAANFVANAAPYMERVDGNVYLCRQNFPAFLFTFIAVNTSAGIFDRALLAMEGTWFDESLVRFEDVELWFRLAEHTRFAFVDEVLTIMRKHSTSITATRPLETRIDGIAVRQRHLARLRHTLSSAEIEAAERTISDLQLHVAYAQHCAGNAGDARRWYRASCRTRATPAAILG